MNWHKKSIDIIASELSLDVERGLDNNEASSRLERYGFNELKEGKTSSFIQKLWKQLKDFLVLILILASIVSAAMGELVDASVIIAIVVINAILGVVQEGKAEKALEALKKMSSPHGKVIRDNSISIIDAKDIVPGDLVVIEAGDIVPADIRLIDSSNLKVEEASLTGESVPSEKDADLVLYEDVSIGDRINMVYMGTIVTYGRGKGIAVGTGGQTEMGKIAEVIQKIDDDSTPLQKKLDDLGKWLGIACIAICVLIFGLGVLRDENMLEMFMVAVSLAVAAIPEGLPAVVTIVLALGMKRMVNKNAIVRRLLAVETLGSITVICSDKTGTLTQNEMTVVKAYANGSEYSIGGKGYEPVGDFLINDEKLNPQDEEGLKLLLSSGLLCNDAVLKNEDKAYSIIGDPTEGALVVAAAKAGIESADYNDKYRRLGEIPFDSDRKMMTTLHADYLPNKIISFTKGAPDIILDRCNRILKDGLVAGMEQEDRDYIFGVNGSFAKQALRVIALAYKDYANIPDRVDSKVIEEDMVFIGLLGMIDPARLEAKEAIKVCKNAGIMPVMITGDYKDTAIAIAKDLGLMGDKDGVLEGSELDRLSTEELENLVGKTSVYARVSPEHKVRIIEALRSRGHITAMTGDGVNDAMALKRADIGVAMGITGTDVAKNTADIVLMDDNFATIVSAVKEGRIIYSNIRKFVYFLLSCNLGEILVIFLSILFQLPVPLLPIQLLWINLVTDSFPALALGTEKGEIDIMDMKPRNPKEAILDKTMIINITIQSIALTVSVLLAFTWALKEYNGDLVLSRTVAFVTIILAELIRAYSSRSERFSIFKLGLFSNKSLVWSTVFSFGLLLLVIYLPTFRQVFHTSALILKDWIFITFFCIIPLLAGEINKLITRQRIKSH